MKEQKKKVGRPPLTEKRKLIEKMRKDGKTFSEIASKLGCSRQNIHEMFYLYK